MNVLNTGAELKSIKRFGSKFWLIHCYDTNLECYDTGKIVLLLEVEAGYGKLSSNTTIQAKCYIYLCAV